MYKNNKKVDDYSKEIMSDIVSRRAEYEGIKININNIMKKYIKIMKTYRNYVNEVIFRYEGIEKAYNDDDTSGCILLGYGAQYNMGDYEIERSTPAFRSFYAKVSQALKVDEKVFIEISSL